MLGLFMRPVKTVAEAVDSVFDRVNDKYEFEFDIKVKVRIVDRKPEDPQTGDGAQRPLGRIAAKKEK